MSQLTPEQLEALRSKHGRIEHVRYNAIDLVFRAPSRMEIMVHRRAADNPQEKHEADERLAQQTCVHPDREEFKALLERYPYATSNKKIANAVMRLSGIMETEFEEPSGSDSKPNASLQSYTGTA